ncbi:NACHT, LRR and PYD domains-containing protein 3-like [Asterias amurensis]|uniref:NACHT, LRR and PYD domains-containing protein 3-like n=1 Tax=Asterias amurensis TaxID=7602 RepID=UPI003AB21528
MMATGTGQTAGLWELAGELGSSWKAIARNLGFTEPQIEHLLEDVPRDSHERCYKMLLQWQKKTRQSERKEQLRQALETAGRLDLIRLWARAEGWSEELNRDEFVKKLKTFVRNKMSKLPLIPWVSTGCVYVDQVFTNVVLLIEFPAAYQPIISPLESYNSIFDSLIDENLGLINLSPTRVLLLGRTGSGKTTLLTKYAFDWCMGKQGSLLADTPVVIVLPMRKLDQHSNLGQAVLDHILPSETRFTASAIERFCEDNPDDVVILLDGYDEFGGKGLKHENCGNIVKMLRNECFTSCRVVVTSRPGRAGDFQNEYENYRHIEITGFSPKDIDEYVYKTFRGPQKPLGDKLLMYLEENHLKTELASLPLMLTAFCQLTKWTDGKDFGELNTISKLYDRLVESVFAHYKSKPGQQMASTVDDITLQELFLELGKVALEGFLGGHEEEIIFSESDFSSSNGPQIIEQGLRVGFLYRDEVSSFVPHSYQELTESLTLSPHRNISFVLKSFQEKFAGKHLAYLCDRDESSCQLFADYLKKVDNHQRVLDLANILVFASAASQKAARFIMVHVTDIFQVQQGENIKQYLEGKLYYKECQKVQRLIELCLQLNFEGRSNGAFNDILNCLFGDICHIRLVEIPNYIAKTLGYLFLHSFQKKTSDEVTGSDASWPGEVETVLSVRSVDLSFVRLESSTEFREFLNCYPGAEELISRSLFDSIDSQRRNVMKPHEISQLLQSTGEERPGYFRDRPDFTYFSVLPICQEVRRRQVDNFNLGFILPALKKCILQELVLNGVKSEDCHWSELFRMLKEGLFREITKLILCLNGLTSCQTASLASSLESTPKLKYLKVSGNEVGEDFVEMLPPLTDVENIILDKAEMSSGAIVKIFEKVKTYPCLTKLDLRRNKQMNETVVDSVCKLLDEKRNWTEFRVSLYDVSAASLVLLKDKLALSHGLTHVYLVHSPVPDTVISCTASILSDLPNLVDLRMSGVIPSASVCSSETVKHFSQELRKAHRLEFLSILYVKMTSLDFISMLNACRDVNSLKVFRYSSSCLPQGDDIDRECRKAKETFLQLWV